MARPPPSQGHETTTAAAGAGRCRAVGPGTRNDHAHVLAGGQYEVAADDGTMPATGADIATALGARDRDVVLPVVGTTKV
jgi:hypothetical protein